MKSAFTLLILLLGLSAAAQVKVEGKITDTKGKPVGGVSITLKDTYDGATTDSIGNFSFAPQLYLDYYLPKTDEKRFTQVFTFTFGYNF